MQNRNIVLPMQRRGGAATESATSDGGLVAVNIRTRGRIGRPADIRASQPLEELVRELRSYVVDLPLVIVVAGTRMHDPKSVGAGAVEALQSVAGRADDAIWLVESSDEQPREPRSTFVTLRRSLPRDAAILRNLVADILFVAGESEAEVEVIRDFAARTPYVMVNSTSPLLRQVIDAAADAGLGVVTLDTTTRTVHLVEEHTPEDLETLAGDVEAMGMRLRIEAARMSTRRTRRATFWRRIMEVFRRESAERSTWERDIIMLAHRSKWPPWAVQMLPKRYVRIPDGQGGSAGAYAWRVLVECVGQGTVEIVGTLCDGEIVHIQPSAEADEFFRQLDDKIGAAILKAINDGMLADRAFGGRVGEIIDEHVARYPRWSSTIQAVARRLNL